MLKSAKTVLVLLFVSGAGSLASCAKPEKKEPAVDVAGMDRSIKPGDDFYGYTNGGWMKATVIPPDRAVYGSFTIIEEEVSKRTVDLIQAAGKAKAPEGSPAGMVGAYYDACMNEEAIEKRGLEPLKTELDAIAAITNRAALARVLGAGLRADVDALNNTDFYTSRPFGLWAAPDFAQPDRNAGYLLQGGLGMPDRDNYRNTDAKAVELQGKYRDHIVGDAEARGRVRRRGAGRPDLRAREEDRGRPRQPDRLGGRSQGQQSVAPRGVLETRAGPRLERLLRGRGALGAADADGLAPVGDLRHRGPRGQGAARRLEGLSVVSTRSTGPRRFCRRPSPRSGSGSTARRSPGAEKPRDRWKRAVSAASAALGDAVGTALRRAILPGRGQGGRPRRWSGTSSPRSDGASTR